MKKLFFSLLRFAGVSRLVAWWHRDQTVFLCYHSVTKSPQLITHGQKLHTPLELFRSHLDYLQSRYRVIPLGEYVAARREGRRLPDYTAVLTFDDGTRNFLTVVAPLLAKRALPATAFIITQVTSERDDSLFASEWTPLDDHLYLSWAEVRQLARMPGIEFGSHSHTHPDLTALPAEEARHEMRQSYESLVEQTGCESPAFAYPHGRASAEVAEAALSVGYSCGLTGELGANDPATDLFCLRRIVIAGDDDASTFSARVSGVTWWYDRARAALKGLLSSERARRAGSLGVRVKVSRAQEESRLVQMKKRSSEYIP
jgi:peptidoglycan/xylan/chitin deacetylase (PgdA/CDA1 family)